MSFIRRHITVIAIGAGCAAVGAGASAIATAGAATGTSPAKSAAAHPHTGRRGAILNRAVHGDVVVATKAGFATASFDRGFVQSVSGPQLTVREGTRTKTYKTVTLTIPSGAHVRDDGKAASLGQLKAGQRVLVWHGPQRTLVLARTPRGG